MKIDFSFLFIAFLLLAIPFQKNYASNSPCSGSKGGIAYCEGAKFVCNDGSYSASTKDCAVVFDGTMTDTTILEPIIDETTGNTILKLDYEGFTVWLDCSKRGAIKFRYTAQRDTGNAKRYDKFMLDANVPAECQQTSVNAYGKKYDRGHQVPANHLDYSEIAIKQTNYMTNILPQASNMNRGAWYLTEEIVECYRDISDLLVIGGVIWGNNPDDDYFVQSHGVKTPDAFWKVIIKGIGQDEQAIAWIVPNTQKATMKQLDKYLVTIDDIEKITGESIPVSDYAKHDKPNQSWLIPIGCNKS